VFKGAEKPQREDPVRTEARVRKEKGGWTKQDLGEMQGDDKKYNCSRQERRKKPSPQRRDVARNTMGEWRRGFCRRVSMRAELTL